MICQIVSDVNTKFLLFKQGKLEDYGPTPEQLDDIVTNANNKFDKTGIIGFFTLRNPDESTDELRLGFVIVDPDKRQKGYGKAMLRLGVKFAFDIYGAKNIYTVDSGATGYGVRLLNNLISNNYEE